MSQTDIKTRFEKALTSFVDKIKNDSNILSVILYGSLANDTVWEKSDMDVYVLVRDAKLVTRSYCVDEDGIIINVNLQTEFDFKRSIERSLTGGLMSSFYSKARVVYSKDDSMKDFLKDFQKMGEDDKALSFFQDTTWLIGIMEKIEKWLVVKDDPLYAQFWALKAVEFYANMLLTLDNKPSSRESVLKVMEYAPEKIKDLYEKPMLGFMTSEEVFEVLNFYKKFLEDNLEMIKKPVIDYMSDGEVRTATNLVKHFRMDSHSIYHVFDFLEEMGIVVRVTENTRITPKSKSTVEEVAFMYSPCTL